jgi:F420-non-reducing hydrogenase large subunit
MSRRITIDPVTRLEGHGKVEVLLDERGDVAGAWLQVPELRGFERFCLGRPAVEMPSITAHVCGVCPAAHHVASARALDALYHVEPPPAAHKIRELYYNLFILEDHALHFYYLGGPDLVVGAGAPAAQRNVLGVMARLGMEAGREIIAARKLARSFMTAIAGRVTHPVFALPGGVSRALDRDLVERMREGAPRLVDFAARTVEAFADGALQAPGWAEMLHAEAFRLRHHSMGLVDAEGRLSFYRGAVRVVDPDGREVTRFAPADYLDHVAEHVEPWTYVKFPYLRARGWKGFEEGADSGLYRVGPLARLNAATRMATPRAQEQADRLFEALGRPAHQTLAFHWARLVEALQAAEEVERLANDPEILDPRVRSLPTEAPTEGVGVVEAPRGTLVHHYRTDERGLLTMVNLIVASQHNAGPVQISIRKAAREVIRGGKVEEGALNVLEMAFRAYDPCNACASHALPGEMPMEVTVRGADGAVREVVARGLEPRT